MTKQKAREEVASDLVKLTHRILCEDEYASHVTGETKILLHAEGLRHAEETRIGVHDGNFTIAQRIHEKMTGDCIALLP